MSSLFFVITARDQDTQRTCVAKLIATHLTQGKGTCSIGNVFYLDMQNEEDPAMKKQMTLNLYKVKYETTTKYWIL